MRISDWSSDVCSSDLTGNEQVTGVPQDSAAGTTPTDPGTAATSVDPSTTYKEDDLIGAAEGVFGKGAQGLAGLIEDILKKQGEPNAYIVGSEAGGARGGGLCYERKRSGEGKGGE